MSITREFTLSCGLVVMLLAVCQPKASNAQFFNPQQQFYHQPRGVGRQGSVSLANSNAFERQLDYGPFGLTTGVTNSRAVTKQNGGTTSIANSNAISREVNLGPLDIGSTLTRTRTRSNGAVSGGIAQDFNVGNLAFGGSLSRDNLRKGFGISRDPNGGADLNLGLISFNLGPNSQQNKQDTLTQAEVYAQGRGAKAGAKSESNTQFHQFGGLQVTDTVSNSNAFGRVRKGQTVANTAGLSGDAYTNANTFGQPFFRDGLSAQQFPTRRRRQVGPQRFGSRPKRRAQYIPFSYPGSKFERSVARRRQPGAVYFPTDSYAQSRGTAPNKGAEIEQQAGANSHSNHQFTKQGASQDNGASSIGSNLANDGSSGQVSSANVDNQNQVSTDGSSSSNNAQSQSLNFDPNQQQASSANVGTSQIQSKDGESIGSHGNSQSTNNGEFGSVSNTANTKTDVVRNGNSEQVIADSSSQSIFQGANGQNAGANTNANVNSQRGPNGFVSNSASSSATATNKGGANAIASASSSSSAGGRGGNSANTNANANAIGFNQFGGGFGQFGGGFSQFGGAQANSGANRGWGRYFFNVDQFVVKCIYKKNVMHTIFSTLHGTCTELQSDRMYSIIIPDKALLLKAQLDVFISICLIPDLFAVRRRDIRQPWLYTVNKTNTPAELLKSTNVAQTQPKEAPQAMPLINYAHLTQQQLQRKQQQLGTEVNDLQKPAINDNSNNRNYYNNYIPTTQQPAAQIINQIKNVKPNNYNQYYGVRLAQSPTRIPPASYPHTYRGASPDNGNKFPYTPQSSALTTAATYNASAEQFEVINTSERSARTFTFIGDLLSGLFPTCVDPCTISAYYQNRCCINLATAPSASGCCPYVPPPISPPRPVLVARPTINCCNTCGYGFYGPPPCSYYGGGGGGYYGSGGGGSIGGNPGGLYIGGGLGNLAYGGLGISLRPIG
ncbi:autotransporter CRAC [Eurosta solidaginis]|uniref:autotransporter CRAC n=1 Tax=Eurosta solidaginis TaxID=178769 RepID=UPI0035317A95